MASSDPLSDPLLVAWVHDPPAARQLNHCERCAIFPGLELSYAKEAFSASRELAVRNRASTCELMDGSKRAAQPCSDFAGYQKPSAQDGLVFARGSIGDHASEIRLLG